MWNPEPERQEEARVGRNAKRDKRFNKRKHKVGVIGFKPQGSAGNEHAHCSRRGYYVSAAGRNSTKGAAEGGSLLHGARYQLSTIFLHWGLDAEARRLRQCSRKGADVAYGDSDVTQTSSSSEP